MPHVHVFSMGVYIKPFVKQVVYAFHIQIYVRLINLVSENEVFHIEIYVTVLKYNGEISVLCENMTFFPVSHTDLLLCSLISGIQLHF